jgi:hypothetical protein
MSSCTIIILFIFGLSITFTTRWPQLLIETKKWELLQICKYECIDPSRSPNFNFEKIVQKMTVALIYYLLNNF